MAGEGMVAVVRGLRDAGLAVTLLDGNRQYTLLPNSITQPASTQRAPVSNNNASTQQCLPKYVADCSTDSAALQCDRDAQVVDGRYASMYKTVHCNLRPTSPPVQLTEFPPQRPELYPGHGNFQVGGNGSGATYSHIRSTSPSPSFRGGLSWPDRGSVCTARPSHEVDAFANSLRKYPCLSPDRSSEVMERLINYTQAKGLSRTFTRNASSPCRIPEPTSHHTLDPKPYSRPSRSYEPEITIRSKRVEEAPTRDRKKDDHDMRPLRNFDVRCIRDVSKRLRDTKAYTAYPYTHTVCPTIKENHDHHLYPSDYQNSSNSVNMEIQAAVKMISKQVATVPREHYTRKTVAVPDSPTSSAGEDNVEGECYFVPNLDTTTSFKSIQTNFSPSDITLKPRKSAQTVYSTIDFKTRNRNKFQFGRKSKSQEIIKVTKDDLKRSLLELIEEVSNSNKNKQIARDELIKKLFQTGPSDRNKKNERSNNKRDRCHKYVSTFCPTGCDYVGDFKELVGKLKYCYGHTKQILRTEIKPFRISEYRQLDFVLKDWINNLTLKNVKYLDRSEILSRVEDRIKELFKNRTKQDFDLKLGIVKIIEDVPIEVSKSYNRNSYLHKLVDVLLNRMRNIVVNKQSGRIRRRTISRSRKILTEEDIRDFLRARLLDFYSEFNLGICDDTLDDLENELFDVMIDSIDCIRSGHIDEAMYDMELIFQDLGQVTNKEANYLSNIILQDLQEMLNRCNFNKTYMILNVNSNSEQNTNSSGANGSGDITDEELNANLDKFTSQLCQKISEWLDTLQIPQIQDKGFKEVVINDLAGDIADRNKYIELNHVKKGSKEDEIEILRYQIFKWINKLVGDENQETIGHAKELFAKIDTVPVPVLIHPRNRLPSTGEVRSPYDPMKPCLDETGPNTCKEDNLKLMGIDPNNFQNLPEPQTVVQSEQCLLPTGEEGPCQGGPETAQCIQDQPEYLPQTSQEPKDQVGPSVSGSQGQRTPVPYTQGQGQVGPQQQIVPGNQDQGNIYAGLQGQGQRRSAQYASPQGQGQYGPQQQAVPGGQEQGQRSSAPFTGPQAQGQVGPQQQTVPGGQGQRGASPFTGPQAQGQVGPQQQTVPGGQGQRGAAPFTGPQQQGQVGQQQQAFRGGQGQRRSVPFTGPQGQDQVGPQQQAVPGAQGRRRSAPFTGPQGQGQFGPQQQTVPGGQGQRRSVPLTGPQGQVMPQQQTVPGGHDQQRSSPFTGPQGQSQVGPLQQRVPGGQGQRRSAPFTGPQGQAQVGPQQHSVPGGQGQRSGPYAGPHRQSQVGPQQQTISAGEGQRRSGQYAGPQGQGQYRPQQQAVPGSQGQPIIVPEGHGQYGPPQQIAPGGQGQPNVYSRPEQMIAPSIQNQYGPQQQIVPGPEAHCYAGPDNQVAPGMQGQYGPQQNMVPGSQGQPKTYTDPKGQSQFGPPQQIAPGAQGHRMLGPERQGQVGTQPAQGFQGQQEFVPYSSEGSRSPAGPYSQSPQGIQGPQKFFQGQVDPRSIPQGSQAPQQSYASDPQSYSSDPNNFRPSYGQGSPGSGLSSVPQNGYGTPGPYTQNPQTAGPQSGRSSPAPYSQGFGPAQPTYGPISPNIQTGPNIQAGPFGPPGTPNQQWNSPESFPPGVRTSKPHSPSSSQALYGPGGPKPNFRVTSGGFDPQQSTFDPNQQSMYARPETMMGPPKGVQVAPFIDSMSPDQMAGVRPSGPGPELSYNPSAQMPVGMRTIYQDSVGPPSMATPRQMNEEYDNYLKQWVQQIPISATTPSEQQTADKARLGMYNGVWKAVTKMKLDPDIFRNPYYYQDVFDEEMERLFKQIPKSQELEAEKPRLKAELLQKTVAMNDLIKSTNVPASFKQQLVENIENSLPKGTQPVNMDDPVQQDEELQKQNLAEYYILYSRYKNEDGLKANVHKKNFLKKLDEFLDTIKKRYGIDMNTNAYANEIINSLDKVPIPNVKSMKDEADDILMGMEVDNWISDLPQKPNNTAPFEKRRVRDGISKKIQEIGTEVDYDDDSFVTPLKAEIPKYLEKIPLQEGTNVDFVVDELANRVKNLSKSIGPRPASFPRSYDDFSKNVPASSSFADQTAPRSNQGGSYFGTGAGNAPNESWRNGKRSTPQDDQWQSLQTTQAPTCLRNWSEGPSQAQTYAQNISGQPPEGYASEIRQPIPVQTVIPGTIGVQGKVYPSTQGSPGGMNSGAPCCSNMTCSRSREFSPGPGVGPGGPYSHTAAHGQIYQAPYGTGFPNASLPYNPSYGQASNKYPPRSYGQGSPVPYNQSQMFRPNSVSFAPQNFQGGSTPGGQIPYGGRPNIVFGSQRQGFPNVQSDFGNQMHPQGSPNQQGPYGQRPYHQAQNFGPIPYGQMGPDQTFPNMQGHVQGPPPYNDQSYGPPPSYGQTYANASHGPNPVYSIHKPPARTPADEALIDGPVLSTAQMPYEGPNGTQPSQGPQAPYDQNNLVTGSQVYQGPYGQGMGNVPSSPAHTASGSSSGTAGYPNYQQGYSNATQPAYPNASAEVQSNLQSPTLNQTAQSSGPVSAASQVPDPNRTGSSQNQEMAEGTVGTPGLSQEPEPSTGTECPQLGQSCPASRAQSSAVSTEPMESGFHKSTDSRESNLANNKRGTISETQNPPKETKTKEEKPTAMNGKEIFNIKSVQTAFSTIDIKTTKCKYCEIRSKSQEELTRITKKQEVITRKDLRKGDSISQQDPTEWFEIHSDKVKVKLWGDKLQKLADKLNKPGGEEKLRIKLEKYLKKVPDQLADAENERLELRRQLPKDIIRKLKKLYLPESSISCYRMETPKYGSRYKIENFRKVVLNWTKSLNIKKKDFLGRNVKKDDVIKYVVDKLEPLVLDRPQSDSEYKVALKYNITEIVDELPLVFSSNYKEFYLNKITDTLVDDIFNIDNKLSSTYIQPTTKEIKEFVKDEITFFLEKSRVAISTKRMECLETELMDLLLDLTDIADIDDNIIEDVTVIFKDIGKLPEYKAKYFTNLLLKDYKEFFFRESFFQVKGQSEHGRSVDYSTLQNDSGIVENSNSNTGSATISFDVYTQRIVEQVRKWLYNTEIPNKDKDFIDAVVKDLASDIVDRHMYLILNPSTKGTDDDEFERLKYQIFKYTNKLVGEDNSSALEHAQELMNAIKTVPKPTVSGSNNEQPTLPKNADVQSVSKAQVDKLTEEIYDWFHELPMDLYLLRDDSLNKLMIKDLAKDIEKGLNKKEDGVIDKEINEWSEKVFYSRLDTYNIEQLRNRIRNLLYSKDNEEKNPKQEKVLVRSYEDIIDEWIDVIQIEPKRQELFKNIKNEIVHELAVKIFKLKFRLSHLPAEIVENNLREEIAHWLKKLPLHPRIDKKVYRDKFAAKLVNDIRTRKQDLIEKQPMQTNKLEGAILQWLWATPLYRKKSALGKQHQETVMKELANKIDTAINDEYFDPDEVISSHIRMLDPTLTEDFVQNMSLKLKYYLQELNMLSDVYPYNEEDEFLYTKIETWLSNLPLQVTDVRRFEQQKTDFFKSMKRLKAAGSDKTAVKKQIIMFIMTLPLSLNNKGDTRYLNEQASKLIQNLSTETSGDVPRIPLKRNDEIISEAIEKWANNLPLKPVHHPEELRSFIEDMSSVIGTFLIHPEYRDIQENKTKLHKEIVKFLRRFPLQHEFCSEIHISRLAGKLVESLKSEHLFTENNTMKVVNNVTVYGVSLETKNTTDDFTIQSIKESDINDNLDKYTKQLVKQIGEWFDSLNLPNIQVEGYKDVVINDLAGDIIDRHKYLELNPDCVTTDEDELEHLKYQIFKWINKLVGEENLETIAHASDLMRKVQQVPVPMIVKPQERRQSQQQQNISQSGSFPKKTSFTLNQDEQLKPSSPAEPHISNISSPAAVSSVSTTPETLPNNITQDPIASASNMNSPATASSINQSINQSCCSQDPPPDGPPPEQGTKEVVYEKYQKIFRQKCDDLPIDKSTPENAKLAELAKTGIYNGIVKTFFKLKSDPEIENDYGYFEFMLEDKIDELLDILPQTEELRKKRHSWKLDILSNAIEMLDELHSFTDRPSFRQNVRNKFNRKFAKDLELEQCFLLQQGFLAEMADAFILQTNYKEKDPLRANIYRNRLMKKIDDLANHLAKEHNVGFRFFKKAQLARIAMKVLEQVPIPTNDILQEEAEEIQLADEVEKWYNELPTKPKVNDTDGLLRKRMVDLLANKIYDIQKRVKDEDPSKEAKIKHEVSQFLERRAKLQPDQDLNINFMVEELNNRLKNIWLKEPLDYGDFEKDKPLSSTFAQVDNDEFLSPLMDDATTSTFRNQVYDEAASYSRAGQNQNNSNQPGRPVCPQGASCTYGSNARQMGPSQSYGPMTQGAPQFSVTKTCVDSSICQGYMSQQEAANGMVAASRSVPYGSRMAGNGPVRPGSGYVPQQGVPTQSMCQPGGSQQGRPCPPGGQVGPQHSRSFPPNGQVCPQQSRLCQPSGQIGPQQSRLCQPSGPIGPQQSRSFPPNGQVCPQQSRLCQPNGEIGPQNSRSCPPNGQVWPQQSRLSQTSGQIGPQQSRSCPPSGPVCSQRSRLCQPRSPQAGSRQGSNQYNFDNKAGQAYGSKQGIQCECGPPKTSKPGSRMENINLSLEQNLMAAQTRQGQTFNPNMKRDVPFGQPGEINFVSNVDSHGMPPSQCPVCQGSQDPIPAAEGPDGLEGTLDEDYEMSCTCLEEIRRRCFNYDEQSEMYKPYQCPY